MGGLEKKSIREDRVNPFVTFVPDRLQKTQKKTLRQNYIRSAQVKEKLLIAIDRLQFLLHKYIYDTLSFIDHLSFAIKNIITFHCFNGNLFNRNEH